MDVRKEFMQYLRKTSFKEVFIILNVDVFPQLVNYVILVRDIQFEDGSYHTYYGELKKVISGFLTYYKYVIDDVIQEADKCTNVMDRNELLVLIDRTIDIHQSRHIYFGREFLPVRSPVEKQAYDEMEVLYSQHMEKLVELKSVIEKLDKQEKVDNFAKEHFKISIRGASELFQVAHDFLSLMLADRIPQIRVSIEELHLRALNNLRQLDTESSEKLRLLMEQLYDKNKSLLMVSRRARRCSLDMAEVNYGIERIRTKIEEYSYDPSITRLEEEVAYWEGRVKEFHQIASKLVLLKKEQEEVVKQEEIFNSMQTTELPGSKRACWLNMGTNFAQRITYLKERILEAARPLMTHFSVRGMDRKMYSDSIGNFIVDEYNHQVYEFDYGMGVYHLNCEGDFKESCDAESYYNSYDCRSALLYTDPILKHCVQVSDRDVHYFDSYGRYTLNSEGEKVYQCAPCTSTYKLTNANLLKKTTIDCGHSERVNKKCRLRITEPGAGEILPDLENVETKNTMNSETVQYLWDSFGHVLPYALHDVGRRHTRNPIQYLAHKLLLHKYNKTKSELEQRKKEAQEYRANIFKERKDKAMAASKAWKAKQVQRRKPEESDETDNRVVYDAEATTQMFLASLNYLN